MDEKSVLGVLDNIDILLEEYFSKKNEIWELEVAKRNIDDCIKIAYNNRLEILKDS
jgi:hypothetical protein